MSTSEGFHCIQDTLPGPQGVHIRGVPLYSWLEYSSLLTAYSLQKLSRAAPGLNAVSPYYRSPLHNRCSKACRCPHLYVSVRWLLHGACGPQVRQNTLLAGDQPVLLRSAPAVRTHRGRQRHINNCPDTANTIEGLRSIEWYNPKRNYWDLLETHKNEVHMCIALPYEHVTQS